MNILLDTHILIWSVGNPYKLGERTQTLLQDDETQVWLSPISLWECLILSEKGRVSLEPSPVAWVRRVIKSSIFQEAPLNHEVAIRSRTIEVAHEDPADRFLCATASVFDLALLTSDTRILEGKGYSVIANE
jgi:PIN domain nuclease of toxin-antitoxin system